MFSRFFIDRPIFASVISIFIVLARPARDAHAPDRAVPRICAAGGHGARGLPGRLAPQVLEQTVAAPIEKRSTASRTCST